MGKVSVLDTWWVSLTVGQKERIASKANKKTTLYPECTKWWMKQESDRKQTIHDHCVDVHGYLLPEWTDKVDATMSY
ncbi:MAG: hypothetical protein K5757_11915 [Bacteroidaceae bacterium]|nr:hypothetical protein [Bacteroidaceae bacterium]